MHKSEKWKWIRSVMSDSATPWTAAHQAPPSMGFSRQKYWSGVPLPSLLSILRSLQFSGIRNTQYFYILAWTCRWFTMKLLNLMLQGPGVPKTLCLILYFFLKKQVGLRFQNLVMPLSECFSEPGLWNTVFRKLQAAKDPGLGSQGFSQGN